MGQGVPKVCGSDVLSPPGGDAHAVANIWILRSYGPSLLNSGGDLSVCQRGYPWQTRQLWRLSSRRDGGFERALADGTAVWCSAPVRCPTVQVAAHRKMASSRARAGR